MPAVFANFLDPYLNGLRSLPFIREIDIRPGSGSGAASDFDAVLRVRTPRRMHRFALERKRTFLDHALTNAVLAQHLRVEKQYKMPLLLLAPYIPGPTGERLAAAGVNFLDLQGNMRLQLGNDHYVLKLGKKQTRRPPHSRRPSPPLIQSYFVLLSNPEAVGWPVRKLAEAAGVGKTVAADVRRRLLEEGILRRLAGGALRLVDRKRLEEHFLSGYAQVLRAHLLIGTFHLAETDSNVLLRQLAVTAPQRGFRWALTGGPAAYRLERFYRSDQIPIFVTGTTPDLERELHLMPQRDGRVTLLRAFGEAVFWKSVGGLPLAHPWLIYAELLHQADPRALEAAQELRAKHLGS
jgi:hypothetical protein